MEETPRTNPFLIPGSIIAAGLIIAGAIAFTDNTGSPDGAQANVGAVQKLADTNAATAKAVKPLTSADHIRGNPDARLTLIEFSDFECPFCQRFHDTMQQVLQMYPDDVKWVYRHFPLTAIHTHAEEAAVASECVAEAGGNAAFWAFADGVFANQQKLGPALYRNIATELGIEGAVFDICLTSGRFDEKVANDASDAMNAGGNGTPYNVIVTDKGGVFPFSGALPFDDPRSSNDVRALIERAKASLK